MSRSARIARELDVPVLAIDYRLAPEHPWPAGIEDSIAAARWAASSPEALGREVTGLVTCGDSAGGNFASGVTLALRDEPAAVPVLAQWPIYPAADPGKGYPSYADFCEGHLLTKGGMDWFEDCYRADPKDWRYPLRKARGMPPTLVVPQPGSDPRPGPRLCRRLRGRRRADHLPRGAGQYPRLHQPQESGAVLGRGHRRMRRRAEIAARRKALEMTAKADLPYRPAAGVMLLSRDGRVWVGQRLDSTLEAWQMPQGGLDPGEDARDGALRELEEERHRRDKVESSPAARSNCSTICPDLIGKMWKAIARPRQTWFLMRFLGEDGDVDLQTPEPEFRAWKWAEPGELPVLIVPFKQKLYEDVLEAFAQWL